FKSNPIIHSVEELEGKRILRRILPKTEIKVEENNEKIWFGVGKNTKYTKGIIPKAYFRERGDARDYLKEVLNGEIVIKKKQKKELEYKVMSSENFPIAIFKNEVDAKNYEKRNIN